MLNISTHRHGHSFNSRSLARRSAKLVITELTMCVVVSITVYRFLTRSMLYTLCIACKFPVISSLAIRRATVSKPFKGVGFKSRGRVRMPSPRRVDSRVMEI